MKKRIAKTHQSFEIGPAVQTEWHILILVSFFFGSVGTGLFIVSVFFDFTWGLALALGVIVLCMGIPHLLFLGRPLRFWRILTSWSAFKTSWLCRGMWSWVVFMVFGLLALFGSLNWLPWTSASIPGTTILGIASAVGIFGMVYPALLMGQSPSISSWSNSVLPILFLVYGLVDGIDLAVALLAMLGKNAGVHTAVMKRVSIAMLIVVGIFLWAYLGTMSASRVGAKEAVRMMARGELAFIFWGVVVIFGLVTPLVVGTYGSVTDGSTMGVSAVMGALSLIGALYFKHSVLRAGVYDTIA